MKKTEPRNEHLPCDAPGCTKATAHGIVLHRVNPREEPAIYMCKDHAIEAIKSDTIKVENSSIERSYQAGQYI